MYKRLVGKRIILRKVSEKDAASIHFHAKDKEVASAVPLPMPYTLSSAKDYIKKTNDFWKNRKEAQFGIEDKESGKIIGMIGLMKLDLDVGKAEVGYWLGVKYWGRGITEEALRLILGYAFESLKLQRVYANVKSKNVASYGLLERCNFKLEGRLRRHGRFKGEWDDLLVFGLLKEEHNL